jgi:hypothetical protein
VTGLCVRVDSLRRTLMRPTPSTQCLDAALRERVYDPAEDTFLLCDALEAAAERIAALRPAICLEVRHSHRGGGGGECSV